MVHSTRNIKMVPNFLKTIHIMKNHPWNWCIYQWFSLSVKGHQSPM